VDADVHPLRAVVFDADSALGEVGCDDDLVAKPGLIDLVMSLFVEGIWVAVVSRRDREHAQTVVRQLIGDGLVETIVSADDLDQPGSAKRTGRRGIGAQPACGRGRRSARRAGRG
jgi:beta-phosphoglucomutase-like phosphatase (HAD superfamily)